MNASARRAEHAIDPLFLNRWSPRSFTGETMPEAQLLACLEAARWAPSASNLQPWRFLYGHIGTPAWQAILDGLVPFNQGWANKASVLIVVLSRTQVAATEQAEARPNVWHAFDAGAAWASLAFQAHLSGWVTHAMGGFDAAVLRANLAIPAEVAIQAVVALGKPGAKAALPESLQAREQASERLPLAQIVAEGAYRF